MFSLSTKSLRSFACYSTDCEYSLKEEVQSYGYFYGMFRLKRRHEPLDARRTLVTDKHFDILLPFGVMLSYSVPPCQDTQC